MQPGVEVRRWPEGEEVLRVGDGGEEGGRDEGEEQGFGNGGVREAGGEHFCGGCVVGWAEMVGL